jgi:hypothetical protein
MSALTNLADRFCSHSKAPALRPFTKEDWYGYAGCETAQPEIGTTDLAEVVLDGRWVNATVSTEPEEPGFIHVAEFPTTEAARVVALAVLADPSKALALLGEPVAEL